MRWAALIAAASALLAASVPASNLGIADFPPSESCQTWASDSPVHQMAQMYGEEAGQLLQAITNAVQAQHELDLEAVARAAKDLLSTIFINGPTGNLRAHIVESLSSSSSNQ